jgi:hypothetical protein
VMISSRQKPWSARVSRKLSSKVLHRHQCPVTTNVNEYRYDLLGWGLLKPAYF